MPLGYAFPRHLPSADHRLVLERAKGALVIPPLLKSGDSWYADLKATGYRYAADAGPGLQVWLKRPGGN